MPRHYVTHERTRTVATAISDAEYIISELRDEMVEWRDNMSGTSLESTSRFADVEDAASTLEGIDDLPEIPEWPSSIECLVSQYEHARLPRWARRDNATNLLRAVYDALEAHRDTLNDGEEEMRGILEDVLEAIDTIASELDAIDFPSAR